MAKAILCGPGSGEQKSEAQGGKADEAEGKVGRGTGRVTAGPGHTRPTAAVAGNIHHLVYYNNQNVTLYVLQPIK